MGALSNTTAATAVPLPPIPKLTRRQEAYARCVAVGMSYADAFRQAGLVASTAGSQAAQIGGLNKHPAVRRRIADLRAKVDDQITSTISDHMAFLRLVISADPAELTKVIREPCGACWSESLLAERMAAYLSPATPFNADEPPVMPDATKARLDCAGCSGRGLTRVVLTPTDELSPAGRALFLGASEDKDGVVEIKTRDQDAALDMLNKMQGNYISKSLNLNANVSVPAARDANPADALKLFAAFDP